MDLELLETYVDKPHTTSESGSRSRSTTHLHLHLHLQAPRGAVQIDSDSPEAQAVTNDNVERKHQAPAAGTDMSDTPFSVFSHTDKRLIILCAGICAFFSPVSGQIYYPALNVISQDLHKSHDLINLTITGYLIMQGLAPAFVGGFSDNAGRRPAYFICFVIYIAANIGLAIQSNYVALLVLRCCQSAGSSGTIALGNAVISDIVTSQERGRYVSYMSVAAQLGPAAGPIIGGLLAQYLGWHAIFWFLLIVAIVVFVPFLLFFPETCRKIVDDGSIPPPQWDRCLLNKKLERRLHLAGQIASNDMREKIIASRKVRFPNPLTTVKIILMKEAGFALVYIGIVACAFFSTVALIPSQFGRVYGFNEIHIALCYIPLGSGSMLSAFVRGRIIDARYQHYAEKLGMPLTRNRHVDLSNFPIERARLEVALPTLSLGSACVIGFGWMVQYSVHLAGPLIFLFLIGFCISASMNTVSVLLVDVFPGKAGAATAANNLCRCCLAAAATAGVVPMINKVGVGWTTTFFGSLIILFSPMLFYIMNNGPDWRRATKEKQEKAKAERVGKAGQANTALEKGEGR